MRQQEQILNYQFPDTTDIERLVLADAVSAPELLGCHFQREDLDGDS